MTKLYVIAGGPGTGKTSVINNLKEYGFYIIHEAAIDIENEENKKPEEKRIVPERTEARGEFQNKVFRLQLERIKAIPENTERAFLDRSFVDTLAYFNVYGIGQPKEIIDIAKGNLCDTVFLLDFPLVYSKNKRGYEIGYLKTKTRPESVEDAKKIHNNIINEYKLYYPSDKIINVPAEPVTSLNNLDEVERSIKQRVYFILKKARAEQSF